MDEKIESLLKRSLELGAEKAKIMDKGSVVVEEWVRWKCFYGCAFCNKDAYHPPYAPGAESTKKIMREYSKAVLMTGSKGKALTEVAVRLEGEAYHLGYYKAFAMTALSSGPEGAARPSGEKETPGESQTAEQKKSRIRPLMEACGIDVFKTARDNGFEIDTKRETYGRWNYFAPGLLACLLLLSYSYKACNLFLCGNCANFVIMGFSTHYRASKTLTLCAGAKWEYLRVILISLCPASCPIESPVS